MKNLIFAILILLTLPTSAQEYISYSVRPAGSASSGSNATLSDTTNLSLWLKADEGYSTTWADQTGHGNDATLTGSSSIANELNGLPAIRFNSSSSEHASITDNASLQSTVGYTIFMVFKIYDQTTLQSFLRNKPLGAAQSTSGFSIEVSANSYTTNTNIADNTTTRAWGWSSGGGTLPTDYFVAVWVLPPNKDNSRFIHDNTELSITTTSYGTDGSPLTGTVDGIDLHIACEPSSQTRHADISVVELLIFKEASSTTKINTVRSYLSQRTGISLTDL